MRKLYHNELCLEYARGDTSYSFEDAKKGTQDGIHDPPFEH